MARPTETSAAAIARMNRNITCPSACCHRAPATTHPRPAALSITSNDIRTKTELRRTSRPVSPSENKIPASSSPSLMGICVMLNLPFFDVAVAQVIRANQSRQQEHGSKFDTNQVRSKQCDPDLLGFHPASP